MGTNDLIILSQLLALDLLSPLIGFEIYPIIKWI